MNNQKSVRKSSRGSNKPTHRGGRGRRESARRKATRKLPPPLPEEIFDFDKADEAGIVFWCQGCHELIEPEKGKRGKFICPKCQEEKVIWGTQKSVQNYSSHQQKDRLVK